MENEISSDWQIAAEVNLKGLRIELSKPVLVRRSRWYCWFPSLIVRPHGELWAVMNVYADQHVLDSVCALSRSRDGGLNWDEARMIGDGGLSHLILRDGTALILPYYLKPCMQGMGAPCNLIGEDGIPQFVPSGVTVGGWPRADKSFAPELGLAGFVFNGLVVPGREDGYLTTLYGTFEGDDRYSLVLAESLDGFEWRIRTVIAGADCPLEGQEGPCESALCRLADGRLMCVFRLSSSVPFGQTFSDDEGRTWSPSVTISAFLVEPSLAVLPEGPVGLSGGRPGISVWFNQDGTGCEWQAVDIAAHHNTCVSPADQIGPTSSYTELAVLDDQHLLLIYDRIGCGWAPIPDDSEETKSIWVMRIGVKRI